MSDTSQSLPIALVRLRAHSLPDASTDGDHLLDLAGDRTAGLRLRAPTHKPGGHVRMVGPGEAGHRAELDAVMMLRPLTLWLPIVDVDMLRRIEARLAVAEALHGFFEAGTGIVLEVARPAQALQLQALLRAGSRVRALFWNPAISGAHASPTRTARDLCLLAAAAAGLPVFDRAPPRRDGGALSRDCAAAARLGFAGRVTDDPADAAVIRAAFSGR